MAAPKKPETTIDQIVAVLKEMVSEPMTDQSSIPPTRADVKRVKSMMVSRKKKPAAKKRPAATRKKTTMKRVSRKKAASTKKRSKKG